MYMFEEEINAWHGYMLCVTAWLLVHEHRIWIEWICVQWLDIISVYDAWVNGWVNGIKAKVCMSMKMNMYMYDVYRCM